MHTQKEPLHSGWGLDLGSLLKISRGEILVLFLDFVEQRVDKLLLSLLLFQLVAHHLLGDVESKG